MINKKLRSTHLNKIEEESGIKRNTIVQHFKRLGLDLENEVHIDNYLNNLKTKGVFRQKMQLSS